MSSDAIIDLYERRALDWVGDRSRQTQFFEQAWLDRFLAPDGGTILDLGCGPGKQMAAYLLAQGFDVCGVDSSPTCGRSPWGGASMASWRGTAFSISPSTISGGCFPIFREYAAPGAPLLFTSGPRHGEAIGSFRGEPRHHASVTPEVYRSLLAANDFSVIAENMEDPECDRHSVWLARRAEDR